MKMELPKDPMILLSVINTKLRDFYPTLDGLCEDLEVSKKELTETLGRVGYEYMEDKNINLTEIAFLTGCDDYTYFSRVFKKITGKSPREYRGDL